MQIANSNITTNPADVEKVIITISRFFKKNLEGSFDLEELAVTIYKVKRSKISSNLNMNALFCNALVYLTIQRLQV